MIAKYLFHTLGNISTVMNEIQNAFLKQLAEPKVRTMINWGQRKIIVNVEILDIFMISFKYMQMHTKTQFIVRLGTIKVILVMK